MEIVETRGQALASVRVRATANQLADLIQSSLDPVWAFLRPSGLTTGHNVVIYRGDLSSPEGAEVEIGVQVDRPFDDREAPNGIASSTVPTCRAARLVHRGPYHRLGETYDAIAEWCRAERHTLAGLNWEVYGDWTDDVEPLETEVFMALA